jgi:hypothetical protein
MKDQNIQLLFNLRNGLAIYLQTSKNEMKFALSFTNAFGLVKWY